jgi:hypothetical protein
MVEYHRDTNKFINYTNLKTLKSLIRYKERLKVYLPHGAVVLIKYYISLWRIFIPCSKRTSVGVIDAKILIMVTKGL